MSKLWKRLSGASKSYHDDHEKSLPHICSPSPSQPRRSLQQPQLDHQEQDPKFVLVNGHPYPKEVTIQPHTDEGGDGYYIGDAYEPAKCAKDWEIPSEKRPYLSFVKKISKSFPHLEYLAHWMEVSAAPPKWMFLKDHPEHREERASRTKVCVLDLDGEYEPSPVVYEDIASLKTKLEALPENPAGSRVRLVIVEDLSRDVVETLGLHYDVDPLFFLSHLGDYLFHNARDKWVELPDLEVVARKRNHFNLQYLRARYFKDVESFQTAELESGLFNVLRRLDSDRSNKNPQNSLLDVKGACVTLTRAKTSLWVKPRKAGEPLTAILLVDPTVKDGFPLWGGYRPFENTPSMHADDFEVPVRETLFEDVVYWTKKMTKQDLQMAYQEPRYIGLPMIRIVLAEWRTVLKYMSSMLNKIEWEFAKPHWGQSPSDVDSSLKKLSPWRRNMPSYQAMISEGIDRLFPPEARSQACVDFEEWKAPQANEGIFSLYQDFRLVQRQVNASQTRIQRIQSTITSAINIEESRRAVRQNSNLARLTFLATIFIPLSFTSSFLSMSPDFSSATDTIWMFFAIGVPLTFIALLLVDLSHPQEGLLKRKWQTMKGGKVNSPQQQSPSQASEKVDYGRTIPWVLNNSTRPSPK